MDSAQVDAAATVGGKRRTRFADTAGSRLKGSVERPPSPAPAPEAVEKAALWVESSASAQAEDDAVRKRREKLAAWKARQAQTAAAATVPALPVVAPSLPPAVGRPAHALPLRLAGPASGGARVGGLQLKVGGGRAGPAGAAAPAPRASLFADEEEEAGAGAGATGGVSLPRPPPPVVEGAGWEEEGEEEKEAREEAYHAAFQAVLRKTREAGSGSEVAIGGVGGSRAPKRGREEEEGEGDEEAALYDSPEWGAGGTSALEQLREKLAAKAIKPVDHAAAGYRPFPKAFYVEHPDVTALSESEVAELREDAEITVRGADVPRPIQTWEQSGLPPQLLSQMPARTFTAPFAIQKQALPVIMSGRDIIGVARTGSGKTHAYVLPMLRHVMGQEALGEGEGPIAIVLAPARELVVQIHQEARRFAKHLYVRSVAVYGGAPVADQIGELKRGVGILIATPGRLIDLLTLNAGKLLSFHRVTYVVLDEADRMFDLGFEPQVAKILSLVRPDRQTVLFSATFPSHVEALARKTLRSPVEIVVGGRSKASSDVSQWVEVREEGTKFARTLQLLGEWYEKGSILVFTDTQERCDELFSALHRSGYPPLSLHGGKDQADRDQTLADFKAGLRTLLIATSVAGRGLDVKNLVLVINFSCPNHLEDYVHRVGRTGRAGGKGTAFTFITSGEGAYAGDLVRALKDAKQEDHTPPELRALAAEHTKGVAAGTARKHVSGYASTRGFKFDVNEEDAATKAKRLARLAGEIEAGVVTVEDVYEAGEAARVGEEEGGEEEAPAPTAPGGAPSGLLDGAARATAIAAAIQRQLAASGVLNAAALAASEGGGAGVGVCEELDINEYPQQARWRLMKEGLKRIEEWCGVAITSRGVFVPAGRSAPPGERKLHLLVEGKSTAAVRQAKTEARRLLEEETLRLGANLDRGGAYTKFTV
jgi:ATP-dependent RNA helicase DDX46/PRP5